jgi:hypothetical protein
VLFGSTDPVDREIFDRVTISDEFEFLALPAYEYLS